MSWWNSGSISGFASQALKNAQKKIDKVLDISEEEKQAQKLSTASTAQSSSGSEKSSSEASGGGEFWNTWLTPGKPKSEDGDEENRVRDTVPSQRAQPSAWSMPWSSEAQEQKEEKKRTSVVPENVDLSDMKQVRESILSSARRKSSSPRPTVGSRIEEKKDNRAREGLSVVNPSMKLRDHRLDLGTAISKEDGENSVSTASSEKEASPVTTIDSADNETDIRETTQAIGSADKETDIRWTTQAVSAVSVVEENVPEQTSLDDVVSKFPREESLLGGVGEHLSRSSTEKTLTEENQTMENSDSGAVTGALSSSTGTETVGDATLDTGETTSSEIESVTCGERTNDCVGSNTTENVTVCDRTEDVEHDRFELEETSSSDSDTHVSRSTVDVTKSECTESWTEAQVETSTLDMQNKQMDNDNIYMTESQSASVGAPAPSVKVVESSLYQTESSIVKEVPCAINLERETTLVKDFMFESANASLNIPQEDTLEQSETKSCGSEIYEDTGDVADSVESSDVPVTKFDSSMDTSGDTVIDRADENFEADDDDDEADVDRTEPHVQDTDENETVTEFRRENEEDFDSSSPPRMDDSVISTSTTSSFVKCMIEDAMEDSSKEGSDSHSIGGEKSECSRSMSGHESNDEIDTTTSSDIEIISTPTPNGDRGERLFDLSPLRIALQKTVRKGSPTHMHKRTDSQSSSSTHSREGQLEQLSPGRDYQELGSSVDLYDDPANRRKSSDLPALDEEENPYHPEKLLKKLGEMAEVVHARETKLVQLSKENNDLMETNVILRNQLEQLEQTRETEMEDLNTLTQEFTDRLAESERVFQQAIREKDALKKRLDLAEEELLRRSEDVSLHNVLREKEQQVTELLEEGEKLSKQQLQSNNIIKKLRAKEKENEVLITSQKKKVDDQKKEIDHLTVVLDSKEEMEKKQSEAITQLNIAVQKQETEMTKLKSDSDDAQEKVRSLQIALDNSYKEIAELHRTNAAHGSKAQEAALSTELQVREELRMEMEREQQRFRQQREVLIMQMEDLRLGMARQEKEQNRREDLLRQEIGDLQVRLQEDEVRNQELTQCVTSATRPLLRQIENLQSTYAAQSSSWEKVERNLTERLGETQTQLAAAVEKERGASEKLMDINAKTTSLETQNSRLRQERSQLSAQLEVLKSKVELMEDAKHNEAAQIDVIREQASHEISDLKKEKVFLETQLDMEKSKLDQEKKKLAIAQDQIRELQERESQRPISRGSVSPMSVSRQESFTSLNELHSLSLSQDDMEKNLYLSSPNGSKPTLYDTLRQAGATNLLENLQSQLKLKEGEIVQLQSDIQQLERTRESMARELVNLSNKNDELQEKVLELPELQRLYTFIINNSRLSVHQQLDQRYNALLQMYGEKVEEVNELRLDLHDVKEMYKAQVCYAQVRDVQSTGQGVLFLFAGGTGTYSRSSKCILTMDIIPTFVVFQLNKRVISLDFGQCL
ncbi:hypothetical protein ScPMuIL_003534 [Solemya velum]